VYCVFCSDEHESVRLVVQRSLCGGENILDCADWSGRSLGDPTLATYNYQRFASNTSWQWLTFTYLGGGLFIPRLFHYFPRFLLFICLCSIYLPIHLSSRGMKRGNSAVRLGEVNRALALGFPLSSIARGVHFPSGRQSTAVNRPVSLVRNSLCWHVTLLGSWNLGLQYIFNSCCILPKQSPLTTLQSAVRILRIKLRGTFTCDRPFPYHGWNAVMATVRMCPALYVARSLFWHSCDLVSNERFRCLPCISPCDSTTDVSIINPSVSFPSLHCAMPC
jgi:hypothetical protein